MSKKVTIQNIEGEDLTVDWMVLMVQLLALSEKPENLDARLFLKNLAQQTRDYFAEKNPDLQKKKAENLKKLSAVIINRFS